MTIHWYLGLLRIPLVLFFAISTHTAAMADETSEQKTGILVEEAHITVSEDPSIAGLEFSITNMGSSDVTLISLSSMLTDRIEIFIYEGGNRTVISDLAILQEETLDLASSHIKVELVGVKQKLQPGSTFEFNLHFRDFQTTAIAHVHG